MRAGAAAPDRAVLAQFGLRGAPAALPGGEGVAFRVGSAVVKRVHDPSEAAWVQELLARIVPDGFRVTAPIATTEGEWVVDDWMASEWLPGLQPLAPDWQEVIEAGFRFGEAAEAARSGGGAEVLDQRTHRWAVADRVAWGEQELRLPEPASTIRGRIESLLVSEPDASRVFVHGDLSGNVHQARDGVPVILDVSPYLRPAGWAATIVVVDAVLWNGADPSFAVDFATGDARRDLVGRALLFRLIAEQLAMDPRHGARLAPFERVIAAVC